MQLVTRTELVIDKTRVGEGVSRADVGSTGLMPVRADWGANVDLPRAKSRESKQCYQNKLP